MPDDARNPNRPTPGGDAPPELVSDVAAATNIENDDVVSLARQLAHITDETEYTEQTDDRAVAAACLFVASRICTRPYGQSYLTQTAAAAAGECQGATIRRHARQIPEVVVLAEPRAFDFEHLAELARLAANEQQRREAPGFR